MKYVFLSCFTVAVALAATAAYDIAGDYSGFSKQPYTGTFLASRATITKTGDIYRIVWTFEDEFGYEGIGIVKDGRLCVGYAAHVGYGVAIYKIQSDGVLDGTFGLPGYKEAGTEKLYKN
jgi:hypothetical protein